MTASDDELLAAVAALFAEVDPAPDDLADGVLARLAVEGLETEYALLTLVERTDLLAGTRGAASETTEPLATVALEFAGDTYRVLVRVSTVDGHRRLDGWVVPALPLRVFAGPTVDAVVQQRHRADVDEHGRFELVGLAPGETRLWLLPVDADDATASPFVTPTFLV